MHRGLRRRVAQHDNQRDVVATCSDQSLFENGQLSISLMKERFDAKSGAKLFCIAPISKRPAMGPRNWNEGNERQIDR